MPNYPDSVWAKCIDDTCDMPCSCRNSLSGLSNHKGDFGSVLSYELRKEAGLLLDLPFCLEQSFRRLTKGAAVKTGQSTRRDKQLADVWAYGRF